MKVQIKTVKVSQKGQIAIPSEIQRDLGIKKGDELVLIRKGDKILLEKAEKTARKLEGEFDDIVAISERSLKKIWLNKKDEVWNQYLK